jgi:hypothetical protein
MAVTREGDRHQQFAAQPTCRRKTVVHREHRDGKSWRASPKDSGRGRTDPEAALRGADSREVAHRNPVVPGAVELPGPVVHREREAAPARRERRSSAAPPVRPAVRDQRQVLPPMAARPPGHARPGHAQQDHAQQDHVLLVRVEMVRRRRAVPGIARARTTVPIGPAVNRRTPPIPGNQVPAANRIPVTQADRGPVLVRARVVTRVTVALPVHPVRALVPHARAIRVAIRVNARSGESVRVRRVRPGRAPRAPLVGREVPVDPETRGHREMRERPEIQMDLEIRMAQEMPHRAVQPAAHEVRVRVRVQVAVIRGTRVRGVQRRVRARAPVAVTRGRRVRVRAAVAGRATRRPAPEAVGIPGTRRPVRAIAIRGHPRPARAPVATTGRVLRASARNGASVPSAATAPRRDRRTSGRRRAMRRNGEPGHAIVRPGNRLDGTSPTGAGPRAAGTTRRARVRRVRDLNDWTLRAPAHPVPAHHVPGLPAPTSSARVLLVPAPPARRGRARTGPSAVRSLLERFRSSATRRSPKASRRGTSIVRFGPNWPVWAGNWPPRPVPTSPPPASSSTRTPGGPGRMPSQPAVGQPGWAWSGKPPAWPPTGRACTPRRSPSCARPGG